MIWWLALFTFPLFAQDASVEKYCYSSAAEMRSSHLKAATILLPSDQVTEEDQCLVIQMRLHRRVLIQSYMRNLNPNVHISFSSAEVRREPCKIKVEKIRELNSGNSTVVLNPGEGIITTEATKSSGLETMQITTQGDFELLVNTDSIKGNCRYVTPTRYEISLEVRKDPKPLLPPVPAGTIVILNTTELPAPQEAMKLQTTLQLQQGDRIEIGSLVKDLRSKSNSVTIDPSGTLQKQDGANLEKVFLSLE